MTTPMLVEIFDGVICSRGKSADVEEKKKPIEIPTPRFQLFSAKIHVNKYSVDKPFHLFGEIKISAPHYASEHLFKRHPYEPLRILNNCYIYSLSHPSCSIPVYPSFDIVTNLYAITTDDEQLFFQVTKNHEVFKLSDHKYDTFCKHKIKGPDGYLELLYIILRDPIDAYLEMTFHPDYGVCGKLFSVKIFAYYGGDYDCGGEYGQGYYSVKLLEADDVALFENHLIQLNTSTLAVPANGSLKIGAIIIDLSSKNLIMSTLFELPVKHNGSSNDCIKGEGCSLKVNVNWKFKAATEEENEEIRKVLAAEIQNDEEDGDEWELEDQAEEEVENDEEESGYDEEEPLNMQTETEEESDDDEERPLNMQTQTEEESDDEDYQIRTLKIYEESGTDDELAVGDHRESLNNQTPRFQLFSAEIHLDKQTDYKPGFLHGYISLSDSRHGLPYLFKRHSYESLPIFNKASLYPLAYPSSHFSIPVYSCFLDINAYFYVITMDDELLFSEVSNKHEVFNLSDKKHDTFCTHKIKGADGYLKLLYIIITDPVDAALEVTFYPKYPVLGKPFLVRIYALYGDYYGDDSKKYRIIKLLDDDEVLLFENSKIPLNISCLAVPAKGSLHIRAVITDILAGDVILNTLFQFPVKHKGGSDNCIEAERCSLKVNVNWKYEDATEEENDDGDDGIQTLKDNEELETGDELDQAEIQKDEEDGDELAVGDNWELVKSPTPRFLLFSASIHVDNACVGKPYLLYGYIEVFFPPIGIIFKRDWGDPLCILNKSNIYPNPSCSFPVDAMVSCINAQLQVSTMDEVKLILDEDFEFSVLIYDTFCRQRLEGPYGYLELLYIILQDPVDAFLEMRFHPDYDVRGKLFTVKVFAYYDGGYDDDCGGEYDCGGEDGPGYLNTLKLLEDDDVGLLENSKIPLNTSFLVVPAKGILKIRAIIIDLSSRDVIMDNLFKISVKLKGSSNAYIKGDGCSLELNVDWKYEATTEDIDGIQTLKDDEELETGVVSPISAV